MEEGREGGKERGMEAGGGGERGGGGDSSSNRKENVSVRTCFAAVTNNLKILVVELNKGIHGLCAFFMVFEKYR